LQSVQQDVEILSAAFCAHNIPFADIFVYERVLEEYLNCCSSIAVGTVEISLIEEDLVTFLHTVPTRFIELLEQQNPIAMGLYARCLSLLALFDESSPWWIYGAGNTKVPTKAINTIYELMPYKSTVPRFKCAAGQSKLTKKPSGLLDMI
jgi:hypothetical protein